MKVVRCLNCAGIFHSLTEHFSAARTLNGAMFKLLPEYGPHGMHWSSFPEEPYVRDAELECPGCGAPYMKSSIKIVEIQEPEQSEEPDAQETQEAGPQRPQGKPKGKGKK